MPSSHHFIPSCFPHLHELVHVLRHAIFIESHVPRIAAIAEACVYWLIHKDDVADLAVREQAREGRDKGSRERNRGSEGGGEGGGKGGRKGGCTLGSDANG